MCHGDHPTYGILTFTVAGATFYLLDSYEELTADHIEAAQAAQTDA